MRTIRITFTHSAFRLIFEDCVLADNFAATFGAASPYEERSDRIIEITGKGNMPYSVRLDGKTVRNGLSRDEAAYTVSRVFGDDICSHVSASVCVMHAASVLIDDTVVSFSGASGSGKTTLSLFFSEYGSYVGDEYAILDMETGRLWHEQHPFQLKESNAALLIPDIASPAVLAVQGEFGRAYYASLAFTNRKNAKHTERFKLGVLVFPLFDPGYGQTVINNLPMSKLPDVVLQSLMGQAPPSLLLGRFIKMAARERLKFLEIRFSDGAGAAEKLYAHIQKYTEEG
jgi:hypothetical protein